MPDEWEVSERVRNGEDLPEDEVRNRVFTAAEKEEAT